MTKAILIFENEMYNLYEATKVKECDITTLLHSCPELADIEDFCEDNNIEIVKRKGI